MSNWSALETPSQASNFYNRKTMHPRILRGEDLSFVVGETGIPRALVCLAGNGQLEHAGINYSFGKGHLLLLSAELGACSCRPHGVAGLLEIALPEVA
jgi:hypothetical protein